MGTATRVNMTRSSWEVEKPVEKAADKAPAPVQSTDKPPVKSAEIDNLFSGWLAFRMPNHPSSRMLCRK